MNHYCKTSTGVVIYADAKNGIQFQVILREGLGRGMWSQLPQLPTGSSAKIDWPNLVEQLEALKYVLYRNIPGVSELLSIENHTKAFNMF